VRAALVGVIQQMMSKGIAPDAGSTKPGKDSDDNSEQHDHETQFLA
jgi:hypothetical protein